MEPMSNRINNSNFIIKKRGECQNGIFFMHNCTETAIFILFYEKTPFRQFFSLKTGPKRRFSYYFMKKRRFGNFFHEKNCCFGIFFYFFIVNAHRLHRLPSALRLDLAWLSLNFQADMVQLGSAWLFISLAWLKLQAKLS